MGRLTPSNEAYSRFAAKLSEVEDDLALLRGARERMVAAGTAAAASYSARGKRTATQSSEDGIATVHCDGNGRVVDVEFDPARYRAAQDQELCAAVLQARQRARALARDAERAAEAGA